MVITQNGVLQKDDNGYPVMGGTSSVDNETIINSALDPVTRRLLTDISGAGAGTVTSVSVVSANGFAGTVATATSTPAITLTTTITGILKGNGTAISAATAGTDYVTASSTNTFTNKTYDTAGAGNSFSINGTAISAVTGTGAVVLATAPTLPTSVTIGATGGTTGSIILKGTTSGTVTVKTADAAGTWTLTLPTVDGDAGQFLQTNGSGITTWAASSASAGGSDTQVQYNNAGALGGISGATSNGTTTTFSSGNFILGGATSGTTVLNSGAIAGSSVLTLPVATDTLVGKATTDTFTNKTFNTAGTGNVFQINGTGITAVTGSGAVVLATSPTLVTPALGTPASGVVTNLTGTASININGTVGATTPTTATFTTATINTGLALAENASVVLDPTLSADGKYTGTTIAGTAGAALAFGDLIYLAVADSRWELADADSATTAGGVLMGFCVLAAAADGDPTVILLDGNIRADTAFPALTVGAPVYAGTTAGDIQVAQPSATDDVIQVVGFALTADSIVVRISPDYITHT